MTEAPNQDPTIPRTYDELDRPLGGLYAGDFAEVSASIYVQTSDGDQPIAAGEKDDVLAFTRTESGLQRLEGMLRVGQQEYCIVNAQRSGEPNDFMRVVISLDGEQRVVGAMRVSYAHPTAMSVMPSEEESPLRMFNEGEALFIANAAHTPFSYAERGTGGDRLTLNDLWVMTDDEVQEARELSGPREEAKTGYTDSRVIPHEAYRQGVEALGYLPASLTMGPKTFTFHKEAKEQHENDGSRYRVVADENGREWLLKRADWAKGTFKTADVQSAQLSREEFYAARLAAYVQYPVPETSMVLHDGMAWLAYEYIDDHVDASELSSQEVAQQIINQAAFNARPIFNMLINATHDESNQGIINPRTREYYAQDLDINYGYQLGYDDVTLTKARIRNGALSGIYSIRDQQPLTEEGRAFALAMLQRAAMITDEQAAGIFIHAADMARRATMIRTRAQAIMQLLEEDFSLGFSP